MNDLEKYFAENEGRLISKWKHYFEIYDLHFSRFRDTDVHIVEFGVSHGGSLQMWKHYFGSKAKIFGIDINPHCKELEEDQIDIFIGDQEDREFLKSLKDKIPRLDILLDDGGHMMSQQITTFEELFPYISENGVYLCEDLHTSYWSEFGGGYRKDDTFVEYSKNFIDYINAWHSRESDKLNVTEFTKSVNSLHYYDSVIVIEKKTTTKPCSLIKGTPSVPEYIPKNIIEIQLQHTQNQLKQSEIQLQQTQNQLKRSEAQLEQTQNQLKQSEAQLQQTRSTIEAMTKSKFWKLKKMWMSLKGEKLV